MRSLVALAVLFLGVLVVACDKPVRTTAEAGTSCSSTVASYDALVASGGACTTDADCACFNGGVSQNTPCGGVSDKATAGKLGKLVTDYEAAHCNALMCAAMMCTPACKAGRCVNAPR